MQAAPTAPSGPSLATEAPLKQAFSSHFQIGCAVGGTLPKSLAPVEAALVTRHFAQITAENCMKSGPIHPEPQRYDFAAPDALMAFAAERGQRVVGHTLVWHNQAPQWLYAPGTSRSAALAQMREHIHTVVGRYRGRIQGWDVVNEAVTDADGYLRNTPARAAIGDDYLERAFEFAHEADPEVELYYNDYDIERPAKRERTLRLLDQLQRAGVRLDGVGIQGHWILDQVPFDAIVDAVHAYAALGLKVMITELDIDVVGRQNDPAAQGAGAQVAVAGDPYAPACPEPVLARQAEQYRRLFELFVELRVSRVTFWGPHDGASWLNVWPSKRTNHPLLFDRQSRPKPAFESVLGVAQRS